LLYYDNYFATTLSISMHASWEKVTPTLEQLPFKGDIVIGNDVWNVLFTVLSHCLLYKYDLMVSYYKRILK